MANGGLPWMSRRERRERRMAEQAQARQRSDAAASAPPPVQAATPAPVREIPAGAPTILTVCTGNICRSPMAEVLLRARLAPLGVHVHSAGTQALVGEGMPQIARELAIVSGALESDAAAHTARYLVEPMLHGADLVLTMAREHRSAAAQLAPSRLRRIFTVREFARLASTLDSDAARAAADAAGTDPKARLAAVVEAVALQRGVTMAAPEDDDVIDPYRRSRETYELSASQLVPAIDEVVRVISAALG